MSFSFIGLTPGNVALLPPALFATLSAAQLAELTRGQAAALSGAQIDEITPGAFDGLTTAAMRGLTTASLAAISPKTAALFSAAQIAAIAPAALAAMPLANFAALTRIEASGLTAAQIEAFSACRIAAIYPGGFAALSADALHALSATQAFALTTLQIGRLSGAQLDAFNALALNAADLANLSRVQVAGLTAATIGRLSTCQFDSAIAPHLAWLTALQAPGLTLAQIASLKPAEVHTLTAAALAALSAAQFDTFSADDVAALSAAQLLGVGAAAINGLCEGKLRALDVACLSTRTIPGLEVATLDAFCPSQLAKFSRAQVRSLTRDQVAELSMTNLDALNPLYFGPIQVAGLSACYIRALSVVTFDEAIAPYVAYLNLGAVTALTIPQIESMNSTEIGTISVRQYEAMDPCQQQAVLAGGPIIADAKSQEVDGVLTYSGMLQVLESAAIGGMNVIKFGELRLLASELNTDGGFTTSAYVEQIAQDVIDGNSANAFWNGGSSTAKTLGDLTASSSQSQLEALIGKWFLGTDLASLYLPASVGFMVPSEYQALDLSLFGSGGPSYLDVNQGNLGDGYFLAALAETAYTDPTFIENMIHENSNGTYSVRFEVDGNADYVTVNDQLPVMLDYYEAANGSTLEFANSNYAWSLLIEKAYVQLMEQTSVTAGSVLGVNGDAFADIAGGGGNGISVITGDATSWYGLAAGESTSALGAIANGLEKDLSKHLDVLFASSSLQNGIGNLVNNQMFEVLEVSAGQQMVLLQNPWNGSGIDTGKQMQFWESLSQLAADSDGSADQAGFWVAKIT